MKRASLAAAAFLALAACSDVTSPGIEPAEAPPLTARGGRIVALFTCDQDLVKGTSRCYPVRPTLPAGLRGALILAGSDFSLVSSSITYDPVTEVASHTQRIMNNIVQSIGTSDGTTVDPIRAYVYSGPTVTGGTGIASVRNPDGFGALTGSNQPYWNVGEIINPGYSSTNSYLWQFDVDNTVTSWTYSLALEAPVPAPHGWVTLGGQRAVVSAGEAVEWYAEHFDARGNLLNNVDFTWRSSNRNVATVTETGYILGQAEGWATITATSSNNDVVGSAFVYVY